MNYNHFNQSNIYQSVKLSVVHTILAITAVTTAPSTFFDDSVAY